MSPEEQEAIRKQAMQEFEETLLVELFSELQKRGYGLQAYINAYEFRTALWRTRLKYGLRHEKDFTMPDDPCKSS